jgi:hypothetical protein
MSRAQPLTTELSSQWAASAQFRFLDALMLDGRLASNQIAFHGGTSLHFSWRSPRRSEDLDFLVAKNFSDIHSIVERAGKKTEEAFRADDPEFIVEIRDRTKKEDRMISYELKVSHPDYLGKTQVKVEFWRVDPAYLMNYPVEMRAPIEAGDIVSRISNPVPAATLETAYCDKLTAFATRPYLKWRDIYDLWWIGTQTDAKLDLRSVAAQFLHNVTAYNTIDSLPPAQALRKFLDNDPVETLRKADPDLKRWMPESLWGRLHPQVTAEMVAYVRDALARVADAIEKKEFGASLKRTTS